MRKISTPPHPDPLPEPPPGFPKTLKEFTQMCREILINGTDEQRNKLIKFLNEGKGDIAWARVGLIVEAWEAADAKGKEEFCLIAMNRHLKSGNASLLDEKFIDPETNIEYRQYKLADGTLERIPYATEGMDKYTYDKALNKHFLGDTIKRWSVEGVELVPLDTDEKVKYWNEGNFHKSNPRSKDHK